MTQHAPPTIPNPTHPNPTVPNPTLPTPTMPTELQNTTAPTLIVGAERWDADNNGNNLLRTAALLDACDPLDKTSANPTTLPTLDGLPGQVHARQTPLIWSTFDDETPTRRDALIACGITTAIGIPVFDGEEVASVLVLYLKTNSSHKGAVELWSSRRGRFELGVTGSYYTGLERFAAISQHVNFPMGSGLPGQIWQNAMPRLMTDLASSPKFMRSSGAESSGLTTGFGFPIVRARELKAALLILSSQDSPIARKFETWAPAQVEQDSPHTPHPDPDPDPTSHPAPPTLIRIDAAHHDTLIDQTDDNVPTSVSQAFETGYPTLTKDESTNENMIALPIRILDTVRAVAVIAW